MKHGLLLVDKPPGCTSHDVVVTARRALRQKKIGHCGTLDPGATGLLLLTVGRATRLTRFLIRAPKVYEGTARLGLVTDTYDLSGEIQAEQATDQLTDEAIRSAMEGLAGARLQTPPPYCAKKVNGVKYYELARRGEKVPDEKKEITIYEFRATAEWRPGRDLEFLLSCSSGTYARSLIHELGQLLGCGGVLSGLRRSQVGSFKLEGAIDIEALRHALDRDEDPDTAWAGRAWIPFDEIQLPFGEIVADQQQERRIQNGQSVLIRGLDSQEGDWIKVINRRHQFIAVGSVVERIGSGQVGVVQPRVVFR
ncbi:MAG: tRNA pseudouridine(55) synthase TruB [bacterium]|nr:tRNA pseudouridine(55) synthase TruB [bacterium]